MFSVYFEYYWNEYCVTYNYANFCYREVLTSTIENLEGSDSLKVTTHPTPQT